MTLSFFIGLLISTAYAQAPTPQEYMTMYAAPAIMIEIAKCESKAQQFNADGSVVVNSISKDYGIFQINKMHLTEATSLGYDVMTPSGNIGYALYLYRQYGTQPWNASKSCWGGSSPPPQTGS